MIGQIISHYKVLEKLGEGGMGVVYKAQDTKLDRFVALKFLPSHLSASEQDKARFIQEAKAASAMNHPNICTIYSIDEHEGQLFIAMEFVDGQTLRAKAQSAIINPKSAIDIGIQIADGLAAAHEKGIVHRDIKPENIMIRKDGIAQIMDFGLAKLRGNVSRLTKEGSTVGTAGYMSPEQVQGQDADHRSDIFSLGVVLYELFTGQLPFKGVHETALMYEIVNVDAAPMSTVKPEIDPELDRIVLECLQKEPDERYNSVKDIAKDLKRFKRESSRERVSRITTARTAFRTLESASPELSYSRKRERIWIASSFLFLLMAVGFGAAYWLTKQPQQRTIRFTVQPPERVAPTSQLAISPDGTSLAFTGIDSSGRVLLYVRPLHTLAAQPLAGTEEAQFPFWSPDSRFIGFFAGSKLKKIEATGGPAQVLCDAPNPRGGAWNQDGIIIFVPNGGVGLSRVSAAGGVPTSLTTLDSTRKETSHRWPYFLPDGKHFIYFVNGAQTDKRGIFVTSLDSKEQKLLLVTTTNAVFASPDYLFFSRDRTLMAQRFDLGKLELTGEPFPVAEQVGSTGFNLGNFSVSQNGTLAYASGSPARQLVWFDRNGKQLGRVGPPGIYFDIVLSPDEKRVTIQRGDPTGSPADIWLLDLVRGTPSRFTFDPADDDSPVWSPDGGKIAFSNARGGVMNMYWKISSGAGNEELLFKSNLTQFPNDWSRDGRFLLFDNIDPTTKTDVWVLPLSKNASEDGKPFPILQTAFDERLAQFSPNGRWIAYVSNESSRGDEVYVQSFPPSGGK